MPVTTITAPRRAPRTGLLVRVDVIGAFSAGDDEAVDPDDAVRVMETVMYMLRRLSAADRSELIRLAQAQAAREVPAAPREFLLALPQAFGLVDED